MNAIVNQPARFVKCLPAIKYKILFGLLDSRSAMALFIFLAASARTWIIRINLDRVFDRLGIFLFSVKFLDLVCRKDTLPLFKAIQPVCTCCHHVLI